MDRKEDRERAKKSIVDTVATQRPSLPSVHKRTPCSHIHHANAVQLCCVCRFHVLCVMQNSSTQYMLQYVCSCTCTLSLCVHVHSYTTSLLRLSVWGWCSMSTLVPTCDQVTREARPHDISDVILYQFMLQQIICVRLVQCHQHSPVCG